MTPFSCNTKYTKVGSQDLLIVAVILAGVSSTVSFTNLLITRRTLDLRQYLRCICLITNISILFSIREIYLN